MLVILTSDSVPGTAEVWAGGSTDLKEMAGFTPSFPWERRGEREGEKERGRGRKRQGREGEREGGGSMTHSITYECARITMFLILWTQGQEKLSAERKG